MPEESFESIVQNGVTYVPAWPPIEVIGEYCSAPDNCYPPPWMALTTIEPAPPPQLHHVPAVPEPSTYALLVVGMFAAAFYRRLRRA